jgi:hypothetical protein
MRRFLMLVLVFAGGAAVGWAGREGQSAGRRDSVRQPGYPPPVPTERFAGAVTVRNPAGDVVHDIRPTHVQVGTEMTAFDADRPHPTPPYWRVEMAGGQVIVWGQAGAP